MKSWLESWRYILSTVLEKKDPLFQKYYRDTSLPIVRIGLSLAIFLFAVYGI